MDRYLNFKVELLSGDIEISRFDELLLSTDIVNIHPYKRIQVKVPLSNYHYFSIFFSPILTNIFISIYDDFYSTLSQRRQ